MPYFVRFTVTNESGAAFSYVNPPPVNGILDDDIGTEGASFESCRIALSTDTVAVTGAEYDEDASDIAPGTNYREAPITWRVSG